MEQLPRRGGRYALRLVQAIIVLFCTLLALPGLAAPSAYAGTRPAAAQVVSLPDGTLVRDTSTGKVYVFWTGVKHWISNPETLTALGYSGTPQVALAAVTVASIPEGSTLGVRPTTSGTLNPLSEITSSQVILSIGQPSVALGQAFTVSGSGYRPGETVTVTALNVSSAAQVDASGRFNLPLHVASSQSLGLQRIFARGTTSGNFGVQVFHVAPAVVVQITATPSIVAPGAIVSVSGSGFLPREDVFVYLGNRAVGRMGASATGAISALTFRVAAATPPGVHTVLARGATSARTAVTQITVTGVSPAPTPTIAPIPTIAPTPVVVATASVSPPSVDPGGQTVLSGSGFQPGEQVIIRINGVIQGSIAAGVTGGFTGYIYTVPVGTPAGTYVVTMSGSASGRTASANLTVVNVLPTVASIAISPLNALPGARVTVAGTGFAPGETAIISFNNTVVGNAIADGSGSFTNGTFLVPGNMPAGRYGVSVTGVTSARTGTAVLTVTAPPAIIVARAYLSPSTVVQNGSVSIIGTGFAPHETVLIRIDGTLIAGVPADGSGALALRYSARVSVGGHVITEIGASSARSAGAVLQVLQPVTTTIHLSPGSTHRGASVSVSGTHFSAGEIVLIRFRGELVQAATADGNGNFANVTFTVPGSAPYGSDQVTVTGGRSSRHASANVQVKPAPARGPKLSVAHNKVHRGDTVAVSGKGFFGNEIVLIRFNNSLVQAATTDRHGNFGHANFRIPVKEHYGTYVVKVTGSRSGRAASIKITVVAKSTSVGISATPGNIHIGQRLTVSGHGFKAGELVLITIRGRLVNAGNADKHGNFKISFTLPGSTSHGISAVQAIGSSSHRQATAIIAVL